MSAARAEDVQIELMRAASPERRVELACSLSSAWITFARKVIEDLYPDLDEVAQRSKFVEMLYGAALGTEVEAFLRRRKEADLA